MKKSSRSASFLTQTIPDGTTRFGSTSTTVFGSTKNLIEDLEHFREYCLIDLQLIAQTARKHYYEIKKFLSSVDTVTLESVREYLKTYLDSKYSYANVIKSFRGYFRDYLKRTELVESFKLPRIHPAPILVPSKERLQELYSNLRHKEVKTAFLLLASSGLRLGEVCSLKISDIDLNMRMLIPISAHSTDTMKRSRFSFYNKEAEEQLQRTLKFWWLSGVDS